MFSLIKLRQRIMEKWGKKKSLITTRYITDKDGLHHAVSLTQEQAEEWDKAKANEEEERKREVESRERRFKFVRERTAYLHHKSSTMHARSRCPECGQHLPVWRIGGNNKNK